MTTSGTPGRVLLDTVPDLVAYSRFDLGTGVDDHLVRTLVEDVLDTWNDTGNIDVRDVRDHIEMFLEEVVGIDEVVRINSDHPAFRGLRESRQRGEITAYDADYQIALCVIGDIARVVMDAAHTAIQSAGMGVALAA